MASAALPHRKWAHEPLYDVSRGEVKIYCRCGSQSGRAYETLAEAQQAHKDHVGLKELQKKVAF